MTIGILNEENDLFLHSPIPLSNGLAEKIKALGGEIKMIIAPNLQHWLFIADWSRLFPSAEIWIPGAALGEDLVQKLPPLQAIRVMQVKK